MGTVAAEDHEILLKLVMIGDTGVGKSSLLIRFADDKFTETFISTIGVDFKIKTVKCEGKRVKLQIWDTAGQERFRGITTAYFRGAHGIIIVYDVTDEQSFHNVADWLVQVDRNCREGTIRLLVGNKTDLVKQRSVPQQAAVDLADEYDMRYLEASALNKTNVDLVFESMASEYVRAVNAGTVETPPEVRSSNGTQLTGKKTKPDCCR